MPPAQHQDCWRTVRRKPGQMQRARGVIAVGHAGSIFALRVAQPRSAKDRESRQETALQKLARCWLPEDSPVVLRWVSRAPLMGKSHNGPHRGTTWEPSSLHENSTWAASTAQSVIELFFRGRGGGGGSGVNGVPSSSAIHEGLHGVHMSASQIRSTLESRVLQRCFGAVRTLSRRQTVRERERERERATDRDIYSHLYVRMYVGHLLQSRRSQNYHAMMPTLYTKAIGAGTPTSCVG